MSTYKTVSLSSSQVLTNSSESDLKYSLKGIDLDRAITPKSFDYSIFTPLDDLTRSDQGSVVDLPEGNILILYNSTEILDFDSNRFAEPKPKNKRSVYTKEPLKAKEVISKVPELFGSYISLDEYFCVESSFASNFQHFYTGICSEEKYSNNFYMKRISKEEFQRNPILYMAKFGQLKDAFRVLENSCIRLNEEIIGKYSEIKAQLKWEIFSNSSSNKNFENGRSMFEAFLKIKDLFQNHIHESDLWLQLDESANDLSDLIIEWNELEVANGLLESNDIEQFEQMALGLSEIEMCLRENSPFVAKNCSGFSVIIEEVKLLFAEFLEKFNQEHRASREEVFRYDICLLDDHFKDTLKTSYT